MIDFRKLIGASVQFGHQRSRWCPKMAPWIWGYKGSTHLIDVSKTAYQLEKASQFLEKVASEGKVILWVGTKKAARNAISQAAMRLEMPYVNHRWIGGMLSNHTQVKKSITKLLHYEDIVAKADKYPHYTKKEFNTIQKMVDRLEKNVGGIRDLRWPVGAIVLVDVEKENSALKEAAKMGIPVVALVDTNGDPSLVDYVIPANDDIPQSVELLINYLADAVARGKANVKAEALAKIKEDELAETETAGLLQLQAAGDEEEGAKKKSSGAAKTQQNTKRPVTFKRKALDQDEVVENKKRTLAEKREQSPSVAPEHKRPKSS